MIQSIFQRIVILLLLISMSGSLFASRFQVGDGFERRGSRGEFFTLSDDAFCGRALRFPFLGLEMNHVTA